MINTKNEWWSDFFKGLFLEVQDGFHTAEVTVRQADNIVKLLEPEPGAKIIDVPCGGGRLAIELASRGYKLAGVDITEALMDRGRKRAVEKKLDIEWILGDMREMELEDKFEAAICMGGSFGFFDDAGNAGFLTAVAGCLKPGGKFIFEAHIAESLLPKLSDRDWYEVGDILVLDDRKYNIEEGRINSEWTLIKNGRFEKIDSSIRVYTYRELCRMLGDAGFRVVAAYDGKTMQKFEARSSMLLMLAEKS